MNALKSSTLQVVMVVAISIITVNSSSQAQEISPQLIVIAETMVPATGDAYISLRDQALALPAEEVEALITYLRGDKLQVEKRFLGSVLQIRSIETALTEQFEENLAYMIAKPHPTRHPDHKRYSSRVSSKPSNEDILHFEAVLKFDMPLGAKGSILSRLRTGSRLHRRNIEPFLLIIRSNFNAGIIERTGAALGRTAAVFPDDRVIPALVAAYKNLRLAEPAPSAIGRGAPILSGIGKIGTQEALETLESLMDFEHQLMPKHGLAPWDDADQFGIMDEHWRVVRAHSKAQRQARQANFEWSEEDEQGYQDQLSAVRRRLQVRLLWERLFDSRAELQAKLSGQEYDGKEKYRKALERFRKQYPAKNHPKNNKEDDTDNP
ncbi:MAG: hypothetical protein IH984_15200 [Planctomycetes bacterium]|nr:hypothetical protein [Planctomycetota bacterium]